MARKLSERRKRALRRQTCVLGHRMNRKHRHKKPECSLCETPVCLKHTHMATVRQATHLGEQFTAYARFCSDKCVATARIEAALIFGRAY